MNFSIRRAAEKDFVALNALFGELDEYHRQALPHVFRKPDGPARTQDFLSGVFADPDAVIFIAEIQERIIGLVHAYVRSIPEIPVRSSYRACEIDNIVVRQEYRRQGVGKALMEKVHEWAARMKLDRLELSVWDFNKGSQDFYRDLGYGPVWIRMWRK